ncbi:MAG: MFS transporter [Oscillospiraceae bacterium]|nr:MFS transporter [Oscillospiraceae bacterium]
MNYNKTIFSCFTGYIVQAIINNFIPLLFITLQNQYDIPLAKITLLITVNFCIQLAVDLLSAVFVDKIGYKISIVAAHIFSAAGLILLTVLPELMDPFTGILIAVAVYAVGGGLIEVLISPIMEGCPTDNKATAMSLLHSFYCWGQVGVVLGSTIFFEILGTGNWKILACIWAAVPLINGILFVNAPIAPLISEDEKGMSLKELLTNKVFWLLMVMMVCAGASELSVSQWASFFAEEGLGISKTAGDLAGPMMFAVLMGGARAFYGKYGEKIQLDKFMTASGILCVLSYLMIALVPSPIVSLAGVAVCGLSVGIMWPGTFSKAAVALRKGGTALFSLLVLAGDLGCSGGPTLVGLISDNAGHNMRIGILAAIVFPLGLLPALRLLKKLSAAEKS